MCVCVTRPWWATPLVFVGVGGEHKQCVDPQKTSGEQARNVPTKTHIRRWLGGYASHVGLVVLALAVASWCWLSLASWCWLSLWRLRERV
jgi:hypothetical protein